MRYDRDISENRFLIFERILHSTRLAIVINKRKKDQRVTNGQTLGWNPKATIFINYHEKNSKFDELKRRNYSWQYEVSNCIQLQGLNQMESFLWTAIDSSYRMRNLCSDD